MKSVSSSEQQNKFGGKNYFYFDKYAVPLIWFIFNNPLNIPKNYFQENECNGLHSNFTGSLTLQSYFRFQAEKSYSVGGKRTSKRFNGSRYSHAPFHSTIRLVDMCLSVWQKSQAAFFVHCTPHSGTYKTNVIWKEGCKVMLAANACHQILVHSAHSCQKDHSFLPSFFLQRFPLPDSYLSAHSCFSSGEMGYLYLLEASDLCHFHLIRNFYRIFAIDLYLSDSQKYCLLNFGQFL